MANDAYVRDCPGKYRPNVPTDNKSETCPDQLGPDMDFGNAPILRTLPDGRTLIVIGQKDGHAWALDPDKQGAVVWSPQVGLGLDGGGGAIMWGVGGRRSLRLLSGHARAARRSASPRVRLATGEIAWRASPADGGAAPVTVIPGVVFFGSSTGTVLRVLDRPTEKRSGSSTPHAQFDTVNGVRGEGRQHQRRRARSSPAGWCSSPPAIPSSATARAATCCSRSACRGNRTQRPRSTQSTSWYFLCGLRGLCVQRLSAVHVPAANVDAWHSPGSCVRPFCRIPAAVACAIAFAGSVESTSIAAQSRGSAPECRLEGRPTALPELREASGIAASRSVPGRLWTHNDSGVPEIFALDAHGAATGRLRVSGVRVEEWEAIAAGPCPAGSCLFIADIGDNDASRKRVTILSRRGAVGIRHLGRREGPVPRHLS